MGRENEDLMRMENYERRCLTLLGVERQRNLVVEGRDWWRNMRTRKWR